MARPLYLLVMGVAIWLSLATAASAQEARRSEAREQFTLGEQATAQSDYARALDHFRRAFSLAPNDAVRFNIALCLEHLGRFREATVEYEQAALSDVLDTATREQARSAATHARAALGLLLVEGEPAGAGVRIDAEPLCTLPCRIAVDPGRHRIAARARDRELSADAVVTRGETTTVRLRERPQVQPSAIRVVQPARAAAPRSDRSSSRGITWLTWTGAAVAVVGVAGIVGFGLRARALSEEYDVAATQETYDEGTLMETLANVSIGVSVLGAALVLLDVVLLAFSSDEADAAERTAAIDGLTRF